MAIALSQAARAPAMSPISDSSRAAAQVVVREVPLEGSDIGVGIGQLLCDGQRLAQAALAPAVSPIPDSRRQMLPWQFARSRWKSATPGLASASFCRIASSSRSAAWAAACVALHGEQARRATATVRQVSLEIRDGGVGVGQLPPDRQCLARTPDRGAVVSPDSASASPMAT